MLRSMNDIMSLNTVASNINLKLMQSKEILCFFKVSVLYYSNQEGD